MHAALAIALGLSLPSATSAAIQQKKTTTKRAPKETSQVPASLIRAVRSTVGETARVKNVRSPRSSVVRIILDQSLVKEADYRTGARRKLRRDSEGEGRTDCHDARNRQR